eukprot:6189470-Pleurochrysis_carterae.AAC.1
MAESRAATSALCRSCVLQFVSRTAMCFVNRQCYGWLIVCPPFVNRVSSILLVALVLTCRVQVPTSVPIVSSTAISSTCPCFVICATEVSHRQSLHFLTTRDERYLLCFRSLVLCFVNRASALHRQHACRTRQSHLTSFQNCSTVRGTGQADRADSLAANQGGAVPRLAPCVRVRARARACACACVRVRFFRPNISSQALP